MSDAAMTQRDVPFSAIFGSLFGAVGAWIGMGVGTVIMWLVLPNVDLTAWRDFSGRLEAVKGTVVQADELNLKLYSGKVVRCGYEFIFNGVRFCGQSYSSSLPNVGSEVNVEFPAGRPERSRISGMTAKILPLPFLISMIVPLATFLAVVRQIRKGVRQVMLLSMGVHTVGLLVEKKVTKYRDSDRACELVFEFLDRSNRRHRMSEFVGGIKPFLGDTLTPGDRDAVEKLIVGRQDELEYVSFRGRLFRKFEGSPSATDGQSLPEQSGEGEVSCSLGLLQTDVATPGCECAMPVIERLVYNPRKPARAALLDAMPGQPRIVDDGRIIFQGGAARLLYAIPPMAVATLNVAWYVLWR